MEQLVRKVNRGYQITIPPKYRDKSGLSVGSLVSVKEVDNKLVIEPLKLRSNALNRLKTILAKDNEFANLDEASVSDLVNEEIKASRKTK